MAQESQGRAGVEGESARRPEGSSTVAPSTPAEAPRRGREDGAPQDDCLFCKIVAGKVPATVVRETETTVAFRDINPQAPTHVLVIPKAHYRDAASLAAADPAVLADVVREAGEVAADEKLDSYRIVFNTGSGAGQTVWHVHGHVLGGRGMQWPPG
ncbi:histidine triad nucleotide-binding protein [Streptomyces sp. YC419]|uniref:Histidine triad nucleotide-binding protein n=1 Tax=Streptomyces ureilyticus TaxID=1775131 RepID=A0ABX0E2C5_9ACTN|nr:histidine triad nucleotide-binding protein [Streptomyces ureilyticus]